MSTQPTDAQPTTDPQLSPAYRRGQIKHFLTEDQKAEILAALAQPNRPSYPALGHRYSVAWQVIQNLDKKRKAELGHVKEQPNTTAAAETEASYRRRTKRALPVKDRVLILARIAKGGLEVSATEQLKALQRIDELEGVVTAVQRREAEASGNSAQPLFILPSGPGQVLVQVGPVGPPAIASVVAEPAKR